MWVGAGAACVKQSGPQLDQLCPGERRERMLRRADSTFHSNPDETQQNRSSPVIDWIDQTAALD